MADDDRVPPPFSKRRSYLAPPSIRTTGEVPAVTGKVHLDDEGLMADEPPLPPAWRPAGRTGPDRGSLSRPHPPSIEGHNADPRPSMAPDWMAGVQVPELLVTREFDRADLGPRPIGERVADLAQRIAGLAVVALLAAAVVMVIVGSITGTGPSLR